MLIAIVYWALFVMMSWKRHDEFPQMSYGAPAAEASSAVVVAAPMPCRIDAKKNRLKCPDQK